MKLKASRDQIELYPLSRAGLFHSKLKIAGVDGVKGLWGGGERIFLR
jgi:hypothetical protein